MNGVIIVAAGTGSRMKKDINKQFIKLDNKEIIAYTIDKFYINNEIDDIVYNGIQKLDKNCEVVLVHDGARPFVTEEIINNSIQEAKKHNAVVVGVKVKDTIKVVGEEGNIVDTPNRKYLWSVQTPQVFKYDIITKAYENAYNENYYGTDDAMLVEKIGYDVKMIEGSYDNIKITTQEDLNFGEQILRK